MGVADEAGDANRAKPASEANRTSDAGDACLSLPDLEELWWQYSPKAVLAAASYFTLGGSSTLL